MFPHLNIAKALHLFCTVFGFWNIALLSRQKLRQRFPTAATAATYMRPRWGLWQEITAMLFAPFALRSLKNLKGVKLGWQKTCGAVVRLLLLLSFSPFTTTLTISFFVFFLTNTYNKKIKVIIFAP